MAKTGPSIAFYLAEQTSVTSHLGSHAPAQYPSNRSKAKPMLMPTKAPTHVRRFALLAAALLLGACSADVTSAPTAAPAAKSVPSMFVPSASAKALIGVVDGTYTMTVDPTRDNSFNLGPNHLDIPAGGICDLLWSGYGPQTWDRPCQAQRLPVVLTVIIKNADSDHPSIDFYPAMRFNPTKSVQLYMYAPNVSSTDAKNWQMLYCPDLGGCFDESVNDASLQTNIDYTNNVLFRRVKHFSGYTVAE